MKLILQTKNLETKETLELVFSNSPVVLGRSKICDVPISDPILSRQHCSLEVVTEGQVKLKDLESANGTQIDGKRVSEQTLKAGQKFQIGNTEVLIVKSDLKFDPDEEPTPIELAIEASTKSKAKPAKPSLSVASSKEKSKKVVAKEEERKAPPEELTLKTPTAIKKSTAKPSYKTKDWVQVSLFWKGELTDLQCFERGHIVTIGEEGSNDFLVALPSLPKQFQLLKILPNGIEIHLHPAMKGVVETRKAVQSIDDLRTTGRQSDLGLSTFVQFDDRCLIELGPFSFFIQSVRLNLVAPVTAPLVKEPLFAGVTFAVATAMVLFLLFLQGLTPPTPEVPVAQQNVVQLENPNETPKSVPTPPPPPPPTPKPMKAGETQSVKTRMSGTQGEGAKAAGESGKTGRTTGTVAVKARPIGMVTNSDRPIKSAPKGASGKEDDPNKAAKGLRPDEGVGSGKAKPKGTGTQAPSNDVKPKVKVEDTGISGVLSARGGGGKAASGGTLSGGGLGGELEGSVEGLERGGDIDAKGKGGRGAKGLGLGGGGNSIEVGGLSTKGKGGGSTGFGLGSSGNKGDAAVTYSAEDVQVRDGLTREEIERVVKAHEREISVCWEKALSQNPGGRLKVGWFVNKDGRVESVVDQSSIGAAGNLFGCISAAMQSWQFPRPRGGSGAQVSWPWFFRKGS